MAKAVVKLYRDLPRARKALQQLLSNGFAPEELGLVASPQELSKITELQGVPTTQGTMSGVPVAVSGPMAREMKDGAVEPALLEYLGVAEDGLDYYQFGVLTGGVVIGVTGEEQKLEKARSAIRETETMASEKAVTPGFIQANRMTESDPADAKMTGDFRRY
ncbi:MAG: hypothetical protein QGH23_01185 [Dehalococcoidia bacterium]|jgi:hypothetical protein|nr:hypothetical protein [Dehalococcoidia bacterium]